MVQPLKWTKPNQTKPKQQEKKVEVVMRIERQEINAFYFLSPKSVGNGLMSNLGESIRKSALEKMASSVHSWNLEENFA